MKNWIIFSVCLMPVVLAEVDFPNEITKCTFGDNDCVVKQTNYVFRNFFKGNEGLNLSSLDPLNVGKMRIKQGKNSPVNIDLMFSNSILLGVENTNMVKVSGFKRKPEGPIEMIIKSKKISLVGDYKINGKVLILPIQGNGKSNITIVNCVMKMKYDMKPYERDGKTYVKTDDFKLDVKVKRMYTQFTNLFNGDKALGDNMNQFLNDNWKDIFDELKNAVESSFATVFAREIDNVYSKTAFEDLFVEV